METVTTHARRAKPLGSGRAPGTPNKTTREIRDLARVEGPACVALLAAFRDDETKPAAVRIEAVRILLERGYGRPQINVDVEISVTHSLERLTDAELALRAEQIAARLRGADDVPQLPAALDAVLVDDLEDHLD